MNIYVKSKTLLKQCIPTSIIFIFIIIMATPVDLWATTGIATSGAVFEELLKNKEIDTILIPAGTVLTGNFKISRNVTITSQKKDNGIKISPLDDSKPTLIIDSKLLSWDNAELVTLENIGITSTVKIGTAGKVQFNNVIFANNTKSSCRNRIGIDVDGVADEVDCYRCTFEKVFTGIRVVDGLGKMKLNLENCIFSSIARSVLSFNDHLILNIQNCKWDIDCDYGIILQHDFDEDVSVNIDNNSIVSMNCSGTLPFHEILEKQPFKGSWELTKYNNFLAKRYCKVVNDLYTFSDDNDNNKMNSNDFSINSIISFTSDTVKEKGINNLSKLQAYIPSQFQKYAQSKVTIENIFEMMDLYFLSAIAPLGIMKPFTTSPYGSMVNYSSNKALEDLSHNYFIKNIFYPYLIWANGTAIPLNVANISLNIDSQNALQCLSSLQVTEADTILRDNINSYLQWLQIIEYMDKNSEQIIQFVRQNFPDEIDFQSFCITYLQSIKDLKIAVDRIMRIYLFDIPIDTVLLVGYAKTLKYKNDKNNVMFVARDIAQYYPIAKKLCVTKTTNIFQDTLSTKWREILGKKDKWPELERILGTEKILLEERKDIKSFYESWK